MSAGKDWHGLDVIPPGKSACPQVTGICGQDGVFSLNREFPVSFAKRKVEVHNPTDRRVSITVRNAKGFTLLGDVQVSVNVPAGSSKMVALP